MSTIDIIFSTAIAALGVCVAIIAWLLRGKFDMYDHHLEVCDEIPKVLIIEKLNHLTASVLDLTTATTEMARQQMLQNTQLQQMIGRQLERDAK